MSPRDHGDVDTTLSLTRPLPPMRALPSARSTPWLLLGAVAACLGAVPAAAAPAAVTSSPPPAIGAGSATLVAPPAGATVAGAGIAAPALPYSPVLDTTSMDRTVDPCVDFYQYSCGGWMASHPIPPDQDTWSVYRKLSEDNLAFLGKMLDEAARPTAARDPLTSQIGDFYAACMDEGAIARAGTEPLGQELAAIGAVRTAADLAAEVAHLQLATGRDILFAFGSGQDFKDTTRVIATVGQGRLGLPDRDYYLKDDAHSVEVRGRYVAYVAGMLQRIGEEPKQAAADAHQVMEIETRLARASISRVDERTPDNVYHLRSRVQLEALDARFDWERYLASFDLPAVRDLRELNVAEPAYFSGLQTLLADTDMAALRSYLRWNLISARASQLGPEIERYQFDFDSAYLRGTKEMKPRWRRCVEAVDVNLGEALGRVYVEKNFSPQAKARAAKMVAEIEQAMDADLRQLTWMSAATRTEALRKLHAMTNKIGFPDHWRDYGSVRVTRQDYAGNVERATQFEARRELAKIGRPVDHGEWEMTPPTVNAEYDPLMNEMNFPAGVLQPPLFDARLDDAPNYGDTGATIGHELTHGFDDEGRQFDFAGNLRDWWTGNDGKEFETRARCISDQYARYTVIDDLKINSKLTLGEDVADLGGLILAYMAWHEATRALHLAPADGLTPEQRFFVGYGQSWCTNQRDEDKRLRATTDEHSPARYRTNGVVSNMTEFRQAFGCKVGQPMAPATLCRVW